MQDCFDVIHSLCNPLVQLHLIYAVYTRCNVHQCSDTYAATTIQSRLVIKRFTHTHTCPVSFALYFRLLSSVDTEAGRKVWPAVHCRLWPALSCLCSFISVVIRVFMAGVCPLFKCCCIQRRCDMMSVLIGLFLNEHLSL